MRCPTHFSITSIRRAVRQMLAHGVADAVRSAATRNAGLGGCEENLSCHRQQSVWYVDRSCATLACRVAHRRGSAGANQSKMSYTVLQCSTC